MRRGTFALSLTLSAVAVMVIALVGHIRSPAPATDVGETPLVQPSTRRGESSKPPAVPLLPAPERKRAQEPTEAGPNAGLRAAPEIRSAPPDEEAIRKRIRTQSTPEVELTYALLLEHLGLTAQEKDALLSLLIDMRVEGASFISHGKVISGGRKIDEDERLNRIASVIGDSKLQQFLELERDLRSYVEVGRIGLVLEYNGAPLTDAQRDGLFKIVADVRHQESVPTGSFDPNSITVLEAELARRSEFERHVVELAPSVLAPNQVVYLDEQYQALSYKRTTDLEQDKKRRAIDPNVPLTIPVWN